MDKELETYLNLLKENNKLLGEVDDLRKRLLQRSEGIAEDCSKRIINLEAENKAMKERIETLEKNLKSLEDQVKKMVKDVDFSVVRSKK